MRSTEHLGGEWTLRGWRQNDWELGRTPEHHKVQVADVGPFPARVPGSVRGALVDAGEVPGLAVGRNSRASEWIEHRHWTYSRPLPEGLATRLQAAGTRAVLVCPALDYAGVVLVGDVEVGAFRGSFTPHEFDITDAVTAAGADAELAIVFTDVPDGLGQNGWTSRVRDWKPRFNYGWDWIPRMVQIGIPVAPRLEVRDGAVLRDVAVTAQTEDGASSIRVRGIAPDAATVLITVDGPGVALRHEFPGSGAFDVRLDAAGARLWTVHPVDEQALYRVVVRLVSALDEDEHSATVGFRTVEWRDAESSPAGAAPWLCVVNGRPLFLQGINWVPIRADFADVPEHEVRRRLIAYRDLGVNAVRVWGGSGLESEAFYDLCDELGLLVWQELPLSSSGLDNAPPADDAFTAEFDAIARSYGERLRSHPSLILWGGGNELTEVHAPAVPGTPLDGSHPALAAAAAALAQVDPERRFVPTSPSGPRFEADEREFGLGLHHDVHGPWEHEGGIESWQRYWDRDDAVLRSEVGVAGASGLDILLQYGLIEVDATPEQLRGLWTHSSGWWLRDFDQWDGSTPIEDWVVASQERQAMMLAYAARATKARFPHSTGFFVWLGHDAFPCAVSLSLLDYHGNPKPAALALGEVFREPVASGSDAEALESAGTMQQ